MTDVQAEPLGYTPAGTPVWPLSGAEDDEDAPKVDDEEQDDDEEEDDAPDPQEGKKTSKEAKYRLRAKDAETKAQKLSERIESMQRREVERAVGAVLADGGDLWRYDAALSDFLDDDGELDFDAVQAKVAELIEERPHLAKSRKRRPAPDKSQGAKGSAPEEEAKKPSWGGLLGDSGKRRQVEPVSVR